MRAIGARRNSRGRQGHLYCKRSVGPIRPQEAPLAQVSSDEGDHDEDHHHHRHHQRENNKSRVRPRICITHAARGGR